MVSELADLGKLSPKLALGTERKQWDLYCRAPKSSGLGSTLEVEMKVGWKVGSFEYPWKTFLDPLPYTLHLAAALPPPRQSLDVYFCWRVKQRIFGMVEMKHIWETITILKTGRGWMLTCYHKYWHPRMLAARPVLWGRSLEDLGKFEKPKRKDLKTLRLFLNETTSTEYATVSYPFSQLIHRPFSWMQSFKYAC